MREGCLLPLHDWLPGPPERHGDGPRGPAWYAAGEALPNELASAPSWALESREGGVERNHRPQKEEGGAAACAPTCGGAPSRPAGRRCRPQAGCAQPTGCLKSGAGRRRGPSAPSCGAASRRARRPRPRHPPTSLRSSSGEQSSQPCRRDTAACGRLPKGGATPPRARLAPAAPLEDGGVLSPRPAGRVQRSASAAAGLESGVAQEPEVPAVQQLACRSR